MDQADSKKAADKKGSVARSHLTGALATTDFPPGAASDSICFKYMDRGPGLWAILGGLGDGFHSLLDAH